MDIKKSGLDLVNYEIWYESFFKSNSFYCLVACSVILTLVTIFAVLKKIRKFKFKNISDIDNFNQKIDLLMKSNTKDVRKFYTELNLILREYLTKSLNYDFFSNTDDELLKTLKIDLNFSPVTIAEIAPIVLRSKYAKFSKYEINENQMINDLLELKNAIYAYQCSKAEHKNV